MIAGMESLSPAAPLTAGKPQMTQMNADSQRDRRDVCHHWRGDGGSS
jgi:hypothetical protein